MSIKPRTVDNLGLDASVRYARDQKLVDRSLIEESKLIPQKTEIPTLKPYVPSEFDQMFAPIKTAIWAQFEPPPGFNLFQSLFTYQLIPSLGGFEQQEADLHKVEASGDALDQKKKKRGQKKEDEEPEENFERKTLLKLFLCIQKIDKTLNLIQSRRNQYQKG